MKRAITSLKKASNELLREIAALYPKGVDDDDLVSFPTTTGSNIRAIEIELDDTIYLVKLDDESFYRKFIAKDDEDDEDDESESIDTDDEIDELDDIGEEEVLDDDVDEDIDEDLDEEDEEDDDED